jgi:hypothetical protein
MAKVSLADMTRQEKLELLDELWNDLTRNPDAYESPAWHAEELAETERRVAAGEEKFIDWEAAKRQIISKHK